MTLKPPIHGRDHRPGRSDPLPGVIVYEYPNEGKWLNVEATGPSPSVGQAAIWIESSAGTGTAGSILVNNGNSLMLISSSGVRLQSEIIIMKLTSQALGSGDQFVVAGNPETAPHLGNLFRVENEGKVTIWFRDSASFLKVLDGAGSAIMQLDEDGTLHLKAGANIVNDL